MTVRRSRGKSDYNQKKTPQVSKGFSEVEQLTQHDDPSVLGYGDKVAPKELPVARRYKIEMVEPKNGSSYKTMGPRPKSKEEYPDEWTFKLGTIKYTPLYLSPEEARAFAHKFIRERVMLNVPIHGSKHNEVRTSTFEVHRFKVTAEEKRG